MTQEEAAAAASRRQPPPAAAGRALTDVIAASTGVVWSLLLFSLSLVTQTSLSLSFSLISLRGDDKERRREMHFLEVPWGVEEAA